MPGPQLRLSRRTLLRGLGAALPLPLFEAMSGRARAAPGPAGPLPGRVIFCYVPNGKNVFQWRPRGTGPDHVLGPTLQPLERHRRAFTVLSGLGHPQADGGHSGADTWLTGANLKAVLGSDYTNTVSLDRLLADHLGRHTRLPSLELSDSSGTGPPGHSHTLSFDRAGTPVPAETSPRRLFQRLFVPEQAEDRVAAARQLGQRRSILDAVGDEARRLHQRLGAVDWGKLDEYLGAVQSTETRVRQLESWLDAPRPRVDPRPLRLTSQPGHGHDRPVWLAVMLQLCQLAFATDSTRVITFQWSREAGGFGGQGENHHELSHHGGDPGLLARLARVDRFHVEQLAGFLDRLQGSQERGGTLLDRTLVLYGSGMSSGETGDHSPRDLPLLLAGGAALGLRQGRHLSFSAGRNPPLGNLLLTMARSLGLDLPGFQDATGPLTELTA